MATQKTSIALGTKELAAAKKGKVRAKRLADQAAAKAEA